MRASGLTVERLQRAIIELPIDTYDDVKPTIDELLLWIRSGYSWQELETTGSWHLGTRVLAVERELRGRGFDVESSCREIEVAGSQIPLAEKLEWLEQTGRVPSWSAAVA